MLHSLFLPVQTLRTGTRHAPSTESKDPHFLHIQNVMRKFYVDVTLEVYRYMNEKCSDVLHSLIPLVQSFTAGIRHVFVFFSPGIKASSFL